MASRKGSFLERDVERTLKLAGLNPKLNTIKKGYEIDVFLDIDGYSVLIECKAYERGGLHLINLIHQWESKNKEINANKILFVIIGKDISERERTLAKKHNITIWDENKWERIKDKVIDLKEKSKDYVLQEIDKNFTKNNKIKKVRVKTTQRQKIINSLEMEISEYSQNLENLRGFRKALGIISLVVAIGWFMSSVQGNIVSLILSSWLGLVIFVSYREDLIRQKQSELFEKRFKR